MTRRRIRGRYPHARYMSFNAYNDLFQPTDAVADIDIRPDRRSTNPFVAGHRRDTTTAQLHRRGGGRRAPDEAEAEHGLSRRRRPAACSAPTNQPSTGVTDTERASSGPWAPNHSTARMRPDWERFMRNQLPSPGFTRAIQRVRKPGLEREVMGRFLPRGRYTSTASFERRGC